MWHEPQRSSFSEARRHPKHLRLTYSYRRRAKVATFCIISSPILILRFAMTRLSPVASSTTTCHEALSTQHFMPSTITKEWISGRLWRFLRWAKLLISYYYFARTVFHLGTGTPWRVSVDSNRCFPPQRALLSVSVMVILVAPSLHKQIIRSIGGRTFIWYLLIKVGYMS